MDLPKTLLCHGLSGAAKGVLIFSLIVLFDIGELKRMLLATPETYLAYVVGAAGLASLTAIVEIVLFVCLLSSDEH
ncbi:MAG: hypothetical protein AAF346_01280 [Pseudomonadota bacterium]